MANEEQNRGFDELPHEILGRFSEILDSDTDVRHFRAVCQSWRRSTRLFQDVNFNLPFPIAPNANDEGSHFVLRPRVVHEVTSPIKELEQPPDFWLIKTERLHNGTIRVLNPVVDLAIHNVLESHTFNTCYFPMSEIHKYYTLKRVDDKLGLLENEKYVRKVVITTSLEQFQYVVVVIDLDSRVWFIDSKDKNWALLHLATEEEHGEPNVDPANFLKFEDVVYHRKKFYLVDEWGYILIFDPTIDESIMVVRERIYNCGAAEVCKMHFVVKDKQLYLVQGHYERQFPRQRIDRFSVHRLNHHGRLAEANNVTIANGICFLGEDSTFCICGEKHNVLHSRFFYKDSHANYNVDHVDEEIMEKLKSLVGQSTCVYDSLTGTLGSIFNFPHYASAFWPPPRWLNNSADLDNHQVVASPGPEGGVVGAKKLMTDAVFFISIGSIFLYYMLG